MWKSLLLDWLVKRLSACIEPDDDPIPEETQDEPAEETEETQDEPAEETEETTEDPEPKPLTRYQRDMQAARSRAQDAERQLATARAELEAARRQPASPAQPSEEQRIWQQEEEVLRNPEANDWQKYAINANRAAREARSISQNTLFTAQDMTDKAAFSQLQASKPKLFAAYKDRVETMLTELRSRGNNAPRENLLAILVGKDMLDGKLKSSEVKSTKSGSAPRATTPGARSDVSSSGGGRLSEAEKRERRLENIRI